jgi:hypothetical protein
VKISKKDRSISKLDYFNDLIEALNFRTEEPVIINKRTDKEFIIILPCGCVEVQHSQSKDSKAVSLSHKFCTKHQADYE